MTKYLRVAGHLSGSITLKGGSIGVMYLRREGRSLHTGSSSSRRAACIPHILTLFHLTQLWACHTMRGDSPLARIGLGSEFLAARNAATVANTQDQEPGEDAQRGLANPLRNPEDTVLAVHAGMAEEMVDLPYHLVKSEFEAARIPIEERCPGVVGKAEDMVDLPQIGVEAARIPIEERCPGIVGMAEDMVNPRQIGVEAARIPIEERPLVRATAKRLPQLAMQMSWSSINGIHAPAWPAHSVLNLPNLCRYWRAS
ncbi:hypothetical protein B0H19DRAFT_1075141 [Mycena capillaripes]|nr:hypothetical protein B0H19DRAFT_1075141 [Mycena capillaripes]